MKKFLFYIIVLLIFSTEIVSPQAPKYSNEFLSVGIGARALSMGNSIVSTVQDVTAGYWNPAGLSNLNKNWDIGLMHAEYFAGIANYDYVGVAKKTDNNIVAGASLIRFGVDGILNTTDLIDHDGNFDYSRINKFSVADYALLISLAKKTPIEGLNIGGNIKIIYRNIGKFANAWGFGLDAGIQYKIKDWHFGAVLRDVTSTFNFWSFNENELKINVKDSIFNLVPQNSLELTLPRLITGISRNFIIREKFSLSAELELEFTTDGKRNAPLSFNPITIDPKVGIEGAYKNLIFVRAGINNIQKVKDFDKTHLSLQPNIGIGVQFKNICIDYAFTNIGNVSVAPYSNIFSLRFAFDGLKKQ